MRNGRFCGQKCVKAAAQYKPYGLKNKEEWQALHDRAAGRCEICKNEFDRTPHIDHDHETGKPRGLLCGKCNMGLGKLGDNAMRMQTNTVKLLEMHRLRT